MGLEQLVLALPSQPAEGAELQMNGHQWGGVLDQFAQMGGSEVLIGGAEPLAYPGFWLLVRKCARLRIPRVTAYLSGSLLEPWVQRQVVESGLHVLIALDSVDPGVHDALHGSGSHAKALAALDSLLELGLASRIGLLATATRMNHSDLPALAEWAARRSLARMLWTTVPDSGWPSPQLRSLRLSLEEKEGLGAAMAETSLRNRSALLVSPLDIPEDNPFGLVYSQLLRVDQHGEAYWGFSNESTRLGNLRCTSMKDLLERSAQAVGD